MPRAASDGDSTHAPSSTPAAAFATSNWKCVGDPPEIAAGWRTEIAFVPAQSTNPFEMAMRGAQDKLRTKICVNQDTDRAAADACSFLASKIEPWKTGQNERDVCASAVIKGESIREWSALTTDLQAFDMKLAEAAKRFVGAASSKRLHVALAAVYDDSGVDANQNQLPGGRRADWLAARFRSVLSSTATIEAPPKGWSTEVKARPPLDIVVVGRMWKHTGVGVPMVDVSWSGYFADGHQLESPSGSFPEAAAPSPPATTPPPIPVTPGLYISMDSDHAGSICAGETTQLWLKSNEELFVRVFDLWGKDGAMLVYPPDPATPGKIPANQTIPLGDAKGFEAIPVAGSEEERYVAIGSPTLAGLGRFAAARGYCRLPANEAASLARKESYPPGAKIAVTGYRLLSGKTCPAAPSAAHLKAAERALERLPSCPR